MRILSIMIILIVLLVACGQQNDLTLINSEVEEKEGVNLAASTSQSEAEAETAAADSNEADSSEIAHDEVFQSGLQVGQKPPNLALPTLSGEVFSESKLEGKKVLINFWASWCGPCRTEMPDIIRLDNEYDDLIVVAINVGETQEEVARFVNEFGMEFPVLLDTTTELTEFYQVLALPTTYFLGTDGTIAKKHVGSITYNQLLHAYQNIE